jgi:hypothetical protein
VINTYNDKKSISSEKNLLSNASIMSFVNNSKSRNINRTINISNTTENIKKPLIKVLNTNSGNNNFSNENYKIKYETVSSKLNLINIKYGNLIKLYDEILTKLYKENFNNNIYINLNDFKEFNFNNLNEEQKYAIVVTLINNIFPLVNKENIEIENIFNKIGKIKIKYFNNNLSKKIRSNSNLPSLSNIDINSTMNSEKLNKNMYYINSNNFSSTLYNSRKRNKLEIKDNKIQINSFSLMKFN